MKKYFSAFVLATTFAFSTIGTSFMVRNASAQSFPHPYVVLVNKSNADYFFNKWKKNALVKTDVYSMIPEKMQEKSSVNDVDVWEIMHAQKFKALTNLNLRRSVGTELPPIVVIPTGTVVKSQVDSSSQRPNVLNVGFSNSGLWFMVEYNNHKGFVRASQKYILPWYQE